MQSQCVLKPGQSHKPTHTLTPTAAQAKNDAAFPFTFPTCLVHLLFKDMHTWLRQLQKIAISVRLLRAPSESSERAKKGDSLGSFVTCRGTVADAGSHTVPCLNA